MNRADRNKHGNFTGRMQKKLVVLFMLVLLAFMGLSARLIYINNEDGEEYKRQILSQQSYSSTTIPFKRGDILDKNGVKLAVSEKVYNLVIDANNMLEEDESLDATMAALRTCFPEFDEMAARSYIADNPKSRYYVTLKQLTYDEISPFVQMQADVENYPDIAGVWFEEEYKRVYPNGELACDIVGFTGKDNMATFGLEGYYNDTLNGSDGREYGYLNDDETLERTTISATDGYNVVTTIDANIQGIVEKYLYQFNEENKNAARTGNGARNVGCIIQDIHSGEILAMATLGSYDPNQYLEIYDPNAAAALEQQRLSYLRQPESSEAYTAGKEAYAQALTQARLKQWRNRCISDGYEPGSTFKVLTMAAALDCGAIDLETPFYCRGAEQIPGRSQLLHCWRSAGHGAEKTPQALQNSCNIAFAHIALKLGGERFYDYVQRFGVLEKTGIDLSGESKGVFFDKALVTNTDKWGTASLTSGSFGQTFKLTPLQLLRAISSVVNGGNLMEPYVVSEIIDSNGNTVLKQEPTLVRKTISEETSKLMCSLMESVVTVGTAKNASVPGYSIGGKTGTSEKIDVFDENGQRVLDKIVSFVGVAPMDDPQYIVLVALDTPSRQTGIYISGGVMAAPTVGAVMADILPYLGVKQNLSPEDAAAQWVLLEDMTGLSTEEAAKKLKQAGVEAVTEGIGQTVVSQIPIAGESVPKGSQVLLYLGEIHNENTETQAAESG